MSTRIGTRHLRYFIAVAEELSFRRAAERLHISQPPLSRQIMDLEEELRAALFIRTTNEISLTPAGKIFLAEARKVLAAMECAIRKVREAPGLAAQEVRVGYTTVFDRAVIPEVSTDFLERYPQYQVVETGKTSVRLVRDVKNGAIDVAFVGLHTDTEGLPAEVMFDEPFVAALPERHALAKKKKVGFDDMAAYPFFWFRRSLNPGYFDYFAEYFSRIRFEPSIIPEPRDHHFLLGEIARGRGIALVPASFRKIRRDGVVYRPLANADTLRSGIVMIHRATELTEPVKAYLALARAKNR